MKKNKKKTNRVDETKRTYEKKKIYDTKMRMTRERKNMKKKKPVGLIVERTFRDSSQPLALLKTFPFTRRPINLNRPNFPSPSEPFATFRTFDKTYGSVLSMGLSFDERPDETLTGEKYV